MPETSIKMNNFPISCRRQIFSDKNQKDLYTLFINPIPIQ